VGKLLISFYEQAAIEAVVIGVNESQRVEAIYTLGCVTCCWEKPEGDRDEKKVDRSIIYFASCEVYSPNL
jgi:hypothetical protein